MHVWDDRKKEQDVGRACGNKDGQIMKIWPVVLQFVWPDRSQEVRTGQVISGWLSEGTRMKNERAVVSLVWPNLSQGRVRHKITINCANCLAIRVFFPGESCSSEGQINRRRSRLDGSSLVC